MIRIRDGTSFIVVDSAAVGGGHRQGIRCRLICVVHTQDDPLAHGLRHFHRNCHLARTARQYQHLSIQPPSLNDNILSKSYGSLQRMFRYDGTR